MKKLINYHLKDLRIIFSSLVFLFLFSCGRFLEKETHYKLTISDHLKIYTNEYGALIYDSDLDTLSLKDSDFRSIRLYLGVFKNDFSISELKKQQLDTFVKIDQDSDKIPFLINHDEKGEFIISGFIEDKIFLNHYLGTDKTRIISKEIKFSKKTNFID